MFLLNIGSAKRTFLNCFQVILDALLVKAVTALQGRNVLRKILEANRTLRTLIAEQKATLELNIFP